MKTHGRAQEAGVLQYAWLEKLAKDRHSSLLGPIVSYDENKTKKDL